MPNRQFIKSHVRTASAAMCLVSLLILGCDNTNPAIPMAPDQKNEPEPTQALMSEYFPMTVGSHWTYRDLTTGNEWKREVTGNEKIGNSFYHYFRSSPQLNEPLDFLNTSVYRTTSHQLKFAVGLDELNNIIFTTETSHHLEIPVDVDQLNDTIQRLIDENLASKNSGFSFANDSSGVSITKRDEESLIFLHQYEAYVVSAQPFQSLRIPHARGSLLHAINTKIRGTQDLITRATGNLDGAYIHTVGVPLTIRADTSFPRHVETPAGTFASCVQFQYTPEILLPETIEYRFAHKKDAYKKQEKRRLYEDVIQQETKVLAKLLQSKIRMETMWFAPAVGPVKFEGENGSVVLIDYEIKPAR